MVNIEEILADVRPYIEYYSRLKELVMRLSKESRDINELIEKLMEEERKVPEPFRTDIKILINRLENLR
ncbi:hypothetical protein PNA2_0602 [Pyrococcus sp. NA2]|uniref:hypothetical protein n=1 Tax=Pyrococcus sp. (strain NA2) TaxID=342949 RepID=UPI000209AC20|nr:hypothetical protein [Pyrococcus sp. NA2]AEC51518.1 hypothetical protein PNA2_0602 [Pyrococcus sp. NA2]